MKKCFGLFFAAVFALLLFSFPAFAVEGASLFDSPEVKNIGKYVATMKGSTLSNEITKMEHTGYSLACWNNLKDYGTLPYVFPPVKDICQSREYQKYMTAALGALDKTYSRTKTNLGYQRYFVAAALYPAIEREMKAGKSFEESMAKVLDDEGKVYFYWKTKRQELEELLRMENSLSEGSQAQDAKSFWVSPYFEAADTLLKTRARFQPDLREAASYWEKRGVGQKGIFVSEEANRLVDENHAKVQKAGWAELRIPKSVHGL